MKKIIVIEDDKVLREALTALLRENGYEVCRIVKFEKTEQQIAEEKADLVLLDIILPGTNGQEILRNLRRISDIPVIMLTSKTGETDEILAMSYGADDYITKPYNPALLLLKIEALFRRLKPQEKQEELEYRGVFLNPLKSTLHYQDREIVLSKNEISIFHYLLKNRGKIVSRDELMDYLWDCNDFVDDNTLTVNINRLRKKLEEIELTGVIETNPPSEPETGENGANTEPQEAEDEPEDKVIIPQGKMKVTVICDGSLNIRRSAAWGNENICGRAIRGQSYYVKEIHVVDGKKMVRTIGDLYLSGESEHVQFEQL